MAAKVNLIVIIFLSVTTFISAQSLDWRLFNQSNSPLNPSVSNPIRVAVDSLNNIWVSNRTNLLMYNNKKWASLDSSFKNYTAGLSPNVEELEVDRNGKLLIGRFYNPIIYSWDRINWSSYDPNSGSGLNVVYPERILFDSKNNMWVMFINYWNSAAQMWRDNLGLYNWKNWTNNQVHHISDILVKDSTAFVIGGLGLFPQKHGIYQFLNDQKNSVDTILQNVRMNVLDSKLGLLNDKMILGRDSLFVIKGNSITIDSTLTSFLQEQKTTISCIISQNDSLIWIGTDNGILIRYSENSFTIFDFIAKLDGSSRTITDIAIDKDGNKWIGVKSIGLIEFNEDKIVSVRRSDKETLPQNYFLPQNYPNPFNPTTVISYQLTVGSHVSLKIYDMLGREVSTLVDEYEAPGKYNVQFSAGTTHESPLSSGIYIYRLQAGEYSAVRKMILQK